MQNALFWWSIVSAILNVFLLCASIWLFAQARSEKNKKNDQVKVWMQNANGLHMGLQRIVRDNLDHRYTSTNDMANAVWALAPSAFGMYQSLYEERVMTEEEFKQDQHELREKVKKMNEENMSNQSALSLATVKPEQLKKLT